MKILHIIPYFTPKKGGDVNVCFNLSKIQAKSGHRVTVLTTDFELDEDLMRSAISEGVTVIAHHCVLDFSLFLYSPSIKSWLKKNITEYDIVHLHGLRSYQNISAVKNALGHGIPYVVQPHASTPRRIQKSRLKWAYDQLYGYKIARSASAFIAVSREEAGYDRDMGVRDENVHVVYNGMDVAPFMKLPPQGNFRSKIGIKKDCVLILYLGRIHYVKGLDFLIEGFLEIPEGSKDFKLIIAGPDDGQGEVLRKMISEAKKQEKVQFMGFLSEQEKMEALTDCDIFVHTARYMGGVGIVPLEAILCGKPVIVTKACGELIQDEGWGYVLDFGDKESLKKALKEVIENPKKGIEMAIKGRKAIIENLTWGKVAEKIADVYRNSIDAKKRN